MPSRLGILGAILIGTLAQVGMTSAQAFPGAVGYGRDADGWRGGRIVAVTNLNNEGPGSLRSCAEARGPRVCLIRTSGTIVVDRPILVQSEVYIAGQTSPGDGIQVRLDGVGATPLVIKNAHDVLVRFIKVRPGPTDVPSPAVDSVTVENAQRVYLDHLSLSFATDETFNVHASRGETSDITLARSLLSFSLDHSSHPKGRHSKGALICSYDKSATGCGRITLWRNVFAHHRDRNPDVKASATGPVEIVNNVFFDPISQFGEYYNLVGDTRIVHVGNVTAPGPSTVRNVPPAVEVFLLGGTIPLTLFSKDNLAFRGPCLRRPGGIILGPTATDSLGPAPALSAGLPILPAASLVEALLPVVGDRLHRDALDVRAVTDLRDCTGKVIDAPEDVGGWPALATTDAAPDADGDGLPDHWEASRQGISPTTADDVWSVDPETGLPFIESYLSELAGDVSGSD